MGIQCCVVNHAKNESFSLGVIKVVVMTVRKVLPEGQKNWVFQFSWWMLGVNVSK